MFIVRSLVQGVGVDGLIVDCYFVLGTMCRFGRLQTKKKIQKKKIIIFIRRETSP